jgi:hypothetical protein
MIRRRYFASFSMLLVLSMLAGCAGAPRTMVVGTDEVTSILLIGDLLGGTVELSNGFSHTIGEDDLQKSVSNIYSVKNAPDENMQRVLLKVDSGELEISFTRRDGKRIQRRLFVSPGVTNEVRLW